MGDHDGLESVITIGWNAQASQEITELLFRSWNFLPVVGQTLANKGRDTRPPTLAAFSQERERI
jgi:hypothetical protein